MKELTRSNVKVAAAELILNRFRFFTRLVNI